MNNDKTYELLQENASKLKSLYESCEKQLAKWSKASQPNSSVPALHVSLRAYHKDYIQAMKELIEYKPITNLSGDDLDEMIEGLFKYCDKKTLMKWQAIITECLGEE